MSTNGNFIAMNEAYMGTYYSMWEELLENSRSSSSKVLNKY